MTLSRAPIDKRGKFSPCAIRLSEIFRCMPGDLFPAQHLTEALENAVSVIEVDQEDIVGLSRTVADNRTPETLLIEAQSDAAIGDALAEALDKLKPREADIIRRRYGLGRDQQTYAEIGAYYGRSTERIRQIEYGALRKMRTHNSALATAADARNRNRVLSTAEHASQQREDEWWRMRWAERNA